MAVVFGYPCIESIDGCIGTFDQLKIDIMPAYQRAGYRIALIVAPRINQNSSQHCAIKAERL